MGKTKDKRYISTPLEPELSTTATPASIGFLVMHPGEDPPHYITGKHTFFTFMHVLKGSGSIEIDDFHYELKAGDLYFSLPGQIMHDLEIQDVKAIFIYVPAMYLLKAEPDLFHMRFLQYAQENQHISLQENQARELFRLETHLMHEINAHLPLKENTLLTMFKLFLLSTERYYRHNHQITEEKTESNMLSRQFQACLNLLYDYSVSLAEITDMLQTTPSHLNHVVRKHTGKSARQQIHDKMLNMAKAFLAHTLYNVEEISYQLGFHFPQYFDRVFKKDAGQTPTDYRIERKASA